MYRNHSKPGRGIERTQKDTVEGRISDWGVHLSSSTLTEERSVIFVAVPGAWSSETVLPPWVSVTCPIKPAGVRAAVTRPRFGTHALAYS